MTVSGAELLHLAPFHMSKAIATLDWVSSGRAGAAVRVSAWRDEFGHFGRRTLPAGPQAVGDLFAEAADCVEVVRRPWDSWEDDAERIDTVEGGGHERRSRGRQP